MYGQRKDYSVYTIPIALITFENKGLIQEKESIEIINHLLKQSEKGIRHLLTSYINQKGPKCVHRLVESGRILDSSLELDVFQLNPECINELPTKAIEKRVFNLLRYHFQSKVVDGSYICNVLHSKYAKYLCSQLASFHMQIMNSLFRHKPSQKQYIAVFVKSPEFFNFSCVFFFRFIHAIGNINSIPSVGFQKIFLHLLTQNYDLICIPYRIFFARSDIPGSKFPPFFSCPVKTVHRDNDPFSEQLRQPAHKSRSFGVDMNDIIPAEGSMDCRCE